MPAEVVGRTDVVAAWYVPGPLAGTSTVCRLFALRLACSFAGLALGLVSVVGSMLIDGVGAAGAVAGAVVGGALAGMPVSGRAMPEMRLVSVRTAGTVLRQSPSRPRPMIPAINPIAPRWDLVRRRCCSARPVEPKGSG